MKSPLFKYILLCFMAISAIGVKARTTDQLLISADSAYSAGEFASSVAVYNEIIKENGVSSEILYNLGNAYSRGGDYGKAMVAYQRALRLDPSNKKAAANIKYIDGKVLEANKSELRGKKYSLDSESESFFTSIKNFIVRSHSSNTWAVWAAVCFIAFIAAAALYIFSRNVALRKIGFFGGFAFIGISLITLIFAFMAASYQSPEGVIISPKVKLRTEASLTSQEAPINLTRGTLMKIIDIFPAGVDNPEWYKVRLNSDFVGWIQASDFEAIEL